MSIKDDLELNTPRRTPNHATKSHVVKTKVDGKDKMIRFGEQGASTAGKPKANDSEKTKAKRKSFKARHASNIAKGPASAAYWANKVKWADGGTVSGPSTMTDVGLDVISGFAGPIISSGISLGNQAFTDKPLDQLRKEKAYVDDMLNYSPRTEQGQAINEGFMDATSSGIEALAAKYSELDAQDPDREGLGMYDPVPAIKKLSKKYDETFTDRTKFAISNLFTLGEIVPVAPVIALVNKAQNVAAKASIDNAADNVPGPEAYDMLRERLEETGALQLKEIDVPFSKEDLAKSFKDGKITAYGRKLARSASARQMAEQLPEIKALSEILGDMNILDQRTKMFVTQSDRTGTIDGAGPGYPFIGRQYNKMSAAFNAEFGEYPVSRMLDSDGNSTDYPVWAVDASQTSTELTNNIKSPDRYGSQPDIKPDGTLIIPLIGAADQLRTNKEVFKKLKSAWFSAAKKNMLSPEQREKININLEAITGEKLDILDPNTWSVLREDTFKGRSDLADIMSGKKPETIVTAKKVVETREALNKQRIAKGLEPLDPNPVTVPLGSRKGQIFDYEKILLDSTEPSLIGAPTLALGPTIIRPTPDRDAITMPDAHPGFKQQIMGEAASDKIFEPVPFEIGMPNVDQYGRELFEAKKKEGLIAEARQWGPREYGYNAKLGYTNKGLPSQTIDEEYLKHLQSMGYAEGGGVSFDTDDSKILALGDIGADFVSGIAGPVISSAASLSDQFFTDKDIEELKADNIRYNEALNYNPRTSTGRDVNQAFTGAMSEGMQALARKYEENKDSLGAVPYVAGYIGDRYGELDERTRFGLENAFTVGEVVPVAAGVSALKKAGVSALKAAGINSDRAEAPIRLDPNKVAINEAADRAAGADSSNLQEMYEAMGARQLSTRESGGNWLEDDNMISGSELSPTTALLPLKKTPVLTNRNLELKAEFVKNVNDGRFPTDELGRPLSTMDQVNHLRKVDQELQESWLRYATEFGNDDVVTEELFHEWARTSYPKAYDKTLAAQSNGTGNALNAWIDTQLSKYVRNDLATAGDPILKMANDGEQIHARDPFGEDYAGLGDPYLSEWGSSAHMLDAISLDAKTDLAKKWERAADSQVVVEDVANIAKYFPSHFQITGNQWLERADSSEPINSIKYSPDFAGDLNFDHLIDELSNSIDPDSGLPEKLMINKDKLFKMNVPQASKHVAKVNAWRQEQVDKSLRAATLNVSPDLVDSTLDLDFVEGKGGKWVELPDTAKSDINMDACTAVGKAAGWCTMEQGWADKYGSGKQRLVTLFDSSDRPHVQVNFKEQQADFVERGLDFDDPDLDYETIEEIKPVQNKFDSKKAKTHINQDPNYISKISDSAADFLNDANRSVDNLADVLQEDLAMFDINDLAPFEDGVRVPRRTPRIDSLLVKELRNGSFGDAPPFASTEVLVDDMNSMLNSYTTQGILYGWKDANRFVKTKDLSGIIENQFKNNPSTYSAWADYKSGLLDGPPLLPTKFGMSRGGSVRAEYSPERINLMAQEILAEGYYEGGLVGGAIELGARALGFGPERQVAITREAADLTNQMADLGLIEDRSRVEVVSSKDEKNPTRLNTNIEGDEEVFNAVNHALFAYDAGQSKITQAAAQAKEVYQGLNVKLRGGDPKSEYLDYFNNKFGFNLAEQGLSRDEAKLKIMESLGNIDDVGLAGKIIRNEELVGGEVLVTNPEDINYPWADDYAEGGLVTYNPERINRMAELILQEA